jgi:hypothetical protein
MLMPHLWTVHYDTEPYTATRGMWGGGRGVRIEACDVCKPFFKVEVTSNFEEKFLALGGGGRRHDRSYKT